MHTQRTDMLSYKTKHRPENPYFPLKYLKLIRLPLHKDESIYFTKISVIGYTEKNFF